MISALEFRFRYLILTLLYVLGFIAPWNYALHLDSIRTWQLLAAWVYRTGWMSFSAATILFLVLGIVLAVIAASLRTWGLACAVRRPMHVGMFLHTLVLGVLMPPSGAVFCIVAVGLFLLRLHGVEKISLPGRPRWGRAFVEEIYMWGVVASFAVAGWRYNSQLVLQGVIISLGVALVARAFLPKR